MRERKTMPKNLKTASEISDRCNIAKERILELVETGHIPHYRIDGGPPRFQITETRKWIANNLVNHCEGKPFPQPIKVFVPWEKTKELPPESIRNIDGLMQIDTPDYPPGVYFLCNNDRVMYVGQTTNLWGRIGSHLRDKRREFDSVFFLSVPQSRLDEVESAFIEILTPPQNKNNGCKRLEDNSACEIISPFVENGE